MIIRNQARCLNCNDFIMSINRHDFKSCKCGAVSVDGGVDYLRRLADPGTYQELSISIPVDIHPREAANYLGILCAMEYGVIHTTLEILDLMVVQEHEKYWFKAPSDQVELDGRLRTLADWGFISAAFDRWTLCRELAPWPEDAERRM